MQAYLEDESNVTYVDTINEFNETILAPLESPGIITVSLKGSKMYFILLTDKTSPIWFLLAELAYENKCKYGLLFKPVADENLYLLALVSIDNRARNSSTEVAAENDKDFLTLNGILMGSTNKTDFDKRGTMAEIVLFTTQCENAPNDDEKERYYYVSEDSGRTHFGAFLITMFEALVKLQNKEKVYLYSALDENTFAFYTNMGYDRIGTKSHPKFEKVLPSQVELSRWEHVLVDRQRKMQDIIGTALMLTRGNIAAAALLVYHYPVV